MAKVRQIAGENLTDSELEELAEQLMARARNLRAQRYGMTADEAVDKALREMSEEMVTASQLQKRNTYLSIDRFQKAYKFIEEVWGDDPAAGLQTLLVGSNTLRRGSQRSIDAAQNSLADNWVNGLVSRLERTGKFDLWARGDLDEDVYKALDQMYKDNPDYTGIDRDARELADILYDYQELYRVTLNRAGAFIKKRSDYITHQNHDMFKVRTASAAVRNSFDYTGTIKNDEDANFSAWRDFVLPRLDEEQTFGTHPAESREEWLKKLWVAISTGVHHTSKTGSGYIPSASLAGRVSAERILQFKDATARFEYDRTFGRGGSIIERVMHQLREGAHMAALMQRLGPNPELNLNRLKDATKLLIEKKQSAEALAKWPRQAAIVDAYFAELTGEANVPGLSPTATALRNLRAIQSLSKLGGAVISSVADTAVAASEHRYQGAGALERWLIQLDSLMKGRGSRGKDRAERLRVASELGVAVDYLRGVVHSRFSAHDAVAGGMSRALYTFFKLSGLTWWTDALRMGNAQAMAHRIGMMADRSIPELDAGMQRIFTLFDITADEWDMMRERAVDTVGDKEYLNPSAASRLTDVEIAWLLQKEGVKATARRVAERRELIQNKFRDLFSARANYAVITPGPRTRAIMHGGIVGAKPGSLTGELFRSVFQFKGFPMAVIERVYGREFFGYGPSGRMSDLTKGGFAGLTSFMVYSTILGFVAMYLKAYFQGRDIKQPENPEQVSNLLLASFLQGGGAGLYGDFLFGTARDRYGQSALDALLGPTFGLASQAVSNFKDFQGTAWDVMHQKAKDTGDPNIGGWLNTVINNTPFVNLFYLKMALDYGILFRLQEYANPGYLKRREKHFEDLGQTYALPPSENYRIEERTTEDVLRLLNPL